MDANNKEDSQCIMATEENHSKIDEASVSSPSLSYSDTPDNSEEDEEDEEQACLPPTSNRRGIVHPTSQQIVDRLVELTSEKSHMNQKEIEILGKLTFGNIKAKRQVAATRVLIPCMIESYIRGNAGTQPQQSSSPPRADSGDWDSRDCTSGREGRQAETSSSSSSFFFPSVVHSREGTGSNNHQSPNPRWGRGSKMRSVLLLAPMAPEEEEDISDQEFTRRSMTPQQILVFVKSLQACVVSSNLARTQCRDPRLYHTLLRDLQKVITQARKEATRFKILEATLNLLCVLCMNDGPNSRHLKKALHRHGTSLREYAGGSVDLGQRISFLEAMAK